MKITLYPITVMAYLAVATAPFSVAVNPTATGFANEHERDFLATSSEFVRFGEVIARDETGFTLLIRGSELTSVRVNHSTAIKKGAETIRLSDVMVRDKVSVRLMRSADGSLQAVSVAVRTGFEPRT